MAMRATGGTTRSEVMAVDGWQDRALALALALAGSILVFGAVFGLRPALSLVLAGIAVVAGATVSLRASLARLDAATRRQRMRSIAIALVLATLVVMFYAATIVRLGGNVFNRPI